MEPLEAPAPEVDDPRQLAEAVITALMRYAAYCRKRGGEAVANYYERIARDTAAAEPAISVYLAMQVSDALREYSQVLKVEGYLQQGADWNIMADRVDRRALNRPPQAI